MGELPTAVFAQNADGVFVQGNGPAPGGGLGFTFDDLITGGGPVTFNEQQLTVEVDRGPAQAAKFTTTQTA